MPSAATVPSAGSADEADFAAFRRGFPLLESETYANLGARGITSRAAHAAGVAVLDGHHTAGLDKAQRAVMVAETKAGFARLIGAAAEEISVTNNVSSGVNQIAAGIDWRPGDNVVLGGELEHPNNVFIWLSLAQTRGIQVRFAPLTPGGDIDLEGLIGRIDARTRAVSLACPSLAPGFRIDLKAVGDAARPVDALFLVDAVQAMGVLEVRVRELGIDALATSTSKGLLGLMGCGFLYISRAWAPRIRPPFAAISNVSQDGSTDDSFNGPDFRFHEDGRRFEIGNLNWTGVAVAHASLAELNALGAARIERRAVGLADALREGLDALGYPVMHPADPANRSHLVSLGELSPTGRATRALTEPRSAAFSRALDAADVRYSVRRGVLRLGFHAFNNRDDVDRLVEIARKA